MTVDQIYQIVNDATDQALGESALLQEDLSNLVDVGDAVFANIAGVDNYVKKLIDRIGRVVYTDRAYKAGINLMKDSWEYGSILEKIRVKSLPDAQANDTWQLTPGTSYDPNVFTAPDVEVCFYNKKETYEIAMSFTEEQLKESFTSAEAMNRFISMVYVMIDNSFEVKFEEVQHRLIANAIADTVVADYSDLTTNHTTTKVVNLLYLYQQAYPNATTTTTDMLSDPEFLRFSTYVIGMYVDRLQRMSSLFNIDAKPRFTPKSAEKLILLSNFSRAIETNLLSDAFHDDYLKLPEENRQIVPYWQGSGLSYDIDDCADINVATLTDPTDPSSALGDFKYILGVLFDETACVVCNDNRRVTTNYNGRAEFVNYWYKYDINLINAHDENFVVFCAFDVS